VCLLHASEFWYQIHLIKNAGGSAHFLQLGCFGLWYTENISFIDSGVIQYVIVIRWAQVICLKYTHEHEGPQGPSASVYISGKSKVPML